jgi:hypothetical protein
VVFHVTKLAWIQPMDLLMPKVKLALADPLAPGVMFVPGRATVRGKAFAPAKLLAPTASLVPTMLLAPVVC